LAKKLVDTTHYSLSTAAPARPERRTGERHLSLLRVGALMIGERRELCLIRNISGGGMMIRPYSIIAEGTRLSIELKHGDSVSGVARWSSDMLVGVEFDRPIDVLALLTPAGDGPKPRMPRIDVSCSALLRHDGDVYRVELVNISQGGICVSTTADLTLDGDVVVSPPGLHSAAGVVKWKEGDQYGIGFNRVYPVHELMGFLKDQQRVEQQRQAAA
jgi:hypothetical protein